MLCPRGRPPPRDPGGPVTGRDMPGKCSRHTARIARLLPGTLVSVEPAIRAAVADDLPAVLTLWQEARAEASRTDDIQSLRQLIEHDRSALLIAEADGRMAGSVIAAWDGWRGSIYRLAVLPAYRRQGLGRRLVYEAEKRLSALGAVRVQAVVVQADARAMGFWRAGSWREQTGQLRFTR